MSDWWKPTPAGALPKIPWLSPVVIEYLESLLKPNMRILEHGSGGSTLWFADRCATVTAVESDPDWYAVVSRCAPGNVYLKLWDKRKLPRLSGAAFDLILIDGEPLEDRALYLDAAERLAPGGIVVLDNYNREEYAISRDRIANRYPHKTFNAPVGRYLNTEFYFLGGA